jgi:hypothetical protein
MLAVVCYNRYIDWVTAVASSSVLIVGNAFGNRATALSAHKLVNQQLAGCSNLKVKELSMLLGSVV